MLMLSTDRAVSGTYRGMMSYRQVTGFASPELNSCLEATITCSTACKACADAFLAREIMGDLAQCVLASIECVDICHATWQLLMKSGKLNWRLLNKQIVKCRDACRRCEEICAVHADVHDHCRVCAQSCKRCADACVKLLASQPQYH